MLIRIKVEWAKTVFGRAHSTSNVLAPIILFNRCTNAAGSVSVLPSANMLDQTKYASIL